MKRWKTCNLFRSLLYKQKIFKLAKTSTFLPPELLNFGTSNTSRILSLLTLQNYDNGLPLMFFPISHVSFLYPLKISENHLAKMG